MWVCVKVVFSQSNLNEYSIKAIYKIKFYGWQFFCEFNAFMILVIGSQKFYTNKVTDGNWSELKL